MFISYTPGSQSHPPRPPIPSHSILTYNNSDDISWEAYHDNSVTIDEAYRTITITGGTDVANTNLIDWLYENATLVSR